MRLFSFLLLFFVIVSVGCHRKTVPAKPTAAPPPAKPHTPAKPVTPLLDSSEAASGTVPAPAPVAAKPIIIVDAHGNFAITEKDLPPDASKSILNNSNARAYTPAELKTLSYRYKQIPPRILYVPPALQKTNSRGTYYILMKKFWYWKNPNGYFYLDENYYK